MRVPGRPEIRSATVQYASLTIELKIAQSLGLRVSLIDSMARDTVPGARRTEASRPEARPARESSYCHLNVTAESRFAGYLPGYPAASRRGGAGCFRPAVEIALR